jgi:hypothetical protein
MIAHPHMLHAYWQIPPREFKKIERILRGPGHPRPVLRFYEITRTRPANPRQAFDVEVDLRTKQWKVPIWSGDKSYEVDLGCQASKGRFHRIARSNVVHVPRTEPSFRVSERYLRVEKGQIKGPVSLPVAPVRPVEPVAVSRTKSLSGREVGERKPFKPRRDQMKEESKATVLQEDLPAGEVIDAFQLVQLTEARFLLGLSSPALFQGAHA